jgi:protoporphyrinogen oxidase
MVDVVICGAGPTGLAAAWRAAENGHDVAVIERGDAVGGLCRSIDLNGFRLDVGGHRWVPQSPASRQFLDHFLEGELIEGVRRHVVRIGARTVGHPFSLSEFILARGRAGRMAVCADVAVRRWRGRFAKPPTSFLGYARREFGRRAVEDYFRPQWQKTTGLDLRELDVAYGQRFTGESMHELLDVTFRGDLEPPKERKYLYARLGSGQLWERVAERLRRLNVTVLTNAEITSVQTESDYFVVRGQRRNGSQFEVGGANLINTMPLPNLVKMLRPAAPPRLQMKAAGIGFLGLVCVHVLVRRRPALPFDSIYSPDPATAFYLVEDQSYLSPDMAPDDATALCALLVATPGSSWWAMDDDDLVARVMRDLALLGYPVNRSEIMGALVTRIDAARPDPRTQARHDVSALLDYVRQRGIVAAGRGGEMRLLLSMDKAVDAGLAAAQNVLARQAVA